MKKKVLLLVFVFIATLEGCLQKANKKKFVEVFPLSPYVDSLKFDKDEDVGVERKNGIRTEYFLINENLDYSEVSKDKLSGFISDSLARDLKKYSAIYFTFYKKGSSLNKEFKQSPNNLLSSYTSDKFAEFEYIKGKLFNFDFYKDGVYYEPASTNDGAN